MVHFQIQALTLTALVLLHMITGAKQTKIIIKYSFVQISENTEHSDIKEVITVDDIITLGRETHLQARIWIWV